MIIASPMDHERERVGFDAYHDLLDQCPDNPFAGCRRCAWAAPRPLNIRSKVEKLVPIGGTQGGL